MSWICQAFGSRRKSRGGGGGGGGKVVHFFQVTLQCFDKIFAKI